MGRVFRGAVCLVFGLLPWAVGAADVPVIRVERSDGTVDAGALVRLDGDGLTIASDGRERSISAAEIRVIEPQAVPAPIGGGARLYLVSGGWIDGDDLTWGGDAVVLSRPDGRVELPVGAIRSVAWMKPGATSIEPAAAWRGTLPETVESDLLVVAAGEGHEFVECAIKGVSAEAVTVVLDEETIPVKRAKVVGIQWLRPDAGGPPRGAVAVDVVGGSLRARRVEWSPEELLLDGEIRLPGSAVTRLDWAAGRTIPLATLQPEKLEVEPWFGALGGVPGLTGYFAPRSVSAGEGFPRPGFVIRPRTEAVWRLPADARRLRTVVAPAAAIRAAGATRVVVSVDGRELFRGDVDASVCGPETPEGLPVDIDLTGGRRLAVTVDFGTAADPGGPVRFTSPVIEQ